MVRQRCMPSHKGIYRQALLHGLMRTMDRDTPSKRTQPSQFLGLRIKRPSSILNVNISQWPAASPNASALSMSTSSSTSSHSARPPVTARPSLVVDSSSPPQYPLLYGIPILPLQYNLLDLLDLEQSGEKVEWPAGLSANRASAFIADYELAIRVGGLYTLKHIATPHEEESTAIPCNTQAEAPSATPAIPIMPRLAPTRSIRRRCITLDQYNRRASEEDGG